MSILNAQHAQNAQNAQHAQNAQGGAGGVSGTLLSSALITTRDGLIGSEQIKIGAATAATLPIENRLLRLTREHRGAVLMAEAMEDLRFEMQGGSMVADKAVLSRRGHDDAYLPLMTMIRPGDDLLGKGLPIVANYAELRAERLAEIEAQKTDLISFFASIVPLCPDRHQRSIEFLILAMDIAGAAAQRFKLAFACPRPYFFSQHLQPMIPTPEHGTWPSGHATQAHALATVLTAMTAKAGPAEVRADSQVFRLAARIAANRTVAGVHFAADSAAGAMLGITVGNYIVARAANGKARPLVFDGKTEEANADFHFGALLRMQEGAGPGKTCNFGEAAKVRFAQMIGALWSAAREEVAAQWS